MGDDAAVTVAPPVAASAADSLESALSSLLPALVATQLATTPRLSLRDILAALAEQVGDVVWEAETRRVVSDLVTSVVRSHPRPAFVQADPKLRYPLAKAGLQSGIFALHTGAHPPTYNFDAEFDAMADGESLYVELDQFEPELYESAAGPHPQAIEQQQSIRRSMIHAGVMPEEVMPRQRYAMYQEQPPPMSNPSAMHPASPSPPVAVGGPLPVDLDPEGDVPLPSTSGFNKPLSISAALASFLRMPAGSKVSRTQCIRFCCEYVKEHDLQDPKDRRIILCDETLRQLFGGEEKVSYFTLNKHLSAHFERTRRVYKRRTKPSSAAARDSTVPAGAEDGEDGAAADGPGLEHMRGFNTPMRLSPQLTDFFLTQTDFLPNEPILYLSRPSVVRLIWAYIKQRGLQDDRDGRIIHIQTDVHLQQLLGIDESTPTTTAPGAPPTDPLSITMQKMNASISQHLHKIDRGNRRPSHAAVAPPPPPPTVSADGTPVVAPSPPPSADDDWSRIESLAQQFERRVKHIGNESTIRPATQRPITSMMNNNATAATAATGHRTAVAPPVPRPSSGAAAEEPPFKKLRPDPLVVAEDDADEEDEEDGDADGDADADLGEEEEEEEEEA